MYVVVAYPIAQEQTNQISGKHQQRHTRPMNESITNGFGKVVCGSCVIK